MLIDSLFLCYYYYCYFFNQNNLPQKQKFKNTKQFKCQVWAGMLPLSGKGLKVFWSAVARRGRMGLLCAPLLSRGCGGQGSAGKGFVMSQACSGWAVLLFSLPPSHPTILFSRLLPLFSFPQKTSYSFVIIRTRGGSWLYVVDACFKKGIFFVVFYLWVSTLAHIYRLWAITHPCLTKITKKKNLSMGFAGLLLQ